MNKLKIAVIGAGNMGGALMAGWVRSGRMAPNCITAVDPVAELLSKHSADLGVQICADARKVVARQDVVALALKPQVWKDVVAGFKDLLHSGQVVVSLMAGVRLSAMENVLGAVPLVRVMPNVLAQVGAAGSGICAGAHVTPQQMQQVMDLLNVVGEAVPVSEAQMDAVTGLVGSGPAYVYAIIDAMADGGVRAGLGKDVALRLAVQTVLGAARMVAESGEHPAVLKDRVTSPGGTTIAGLHALEQGGFRAAVMDAVLAAARRSEELGKKE